MIHSKRTGLLLKGDVQLRYINTYSTELLLSTEGYTQQSLYSH